MVEKKLPSAPTSTSSKAPQSLQRSTDAVPEEAYTFTASNKTDHEKDVDIDFNSLHHTIGKGPTQVAAGNHTHAPTDISGLTYDHGDLSGLDDDDHNRYPLAAGGVRATGTWPIDISGRAAVATNADAVNSFTFAWTDTGVQETYVLQAGSPARAVDVFPSRSLSVNYASSAGNADTVDGYHAASFSLTSHGHGGMNGLGIWRGIGTENTLAANATQSFDIVHNWGVNFAAMWIQVTADDGVQSIVAGITSFNANSLTVTARNLGGATETFQIYFFGIL